jgi:hypothetical protein
MKRLEKLSSQKVCVGVPAEDAEREGSDVSNADLVYIHTHGVRPPAERAEMQANINKGVKYSAAMQMYIREHGSFAYQVPPRPIIEPAIENSKEQIGKLLGFAAKQAADNGDTTAALEDVGTYASGKVKAWFTDAKNGWAPNAPSTIKRKGSAQPLIDTGTLRDSITFVVRGEDDD